MWGRVDPQVNKFEQVFSDGHQMSVVGGTPSQKPPDVSSRGPFPDMEPWIPHPAEQNDRHLWKHYLPSTSLAGGKETDDHRFSLSDSSERTYCSQLAAYCFTLRLLVYCSHLVVLIRVNTQAKESTGESLGTWSERKWLLDPLDQWSGSHCYRCKSPHRLCWRKSQLFSEHFELVLGLHNLFWQKKKKIRDFVSDHGDISLHLISYLILIFVSSTVDGPFCLWTIRWC